jgi:hypothetical protein
LIPIFSLGPFLSYGFGITVGQLHHLDEVGTWYKPDWEAAEYINGITNSDDTILTYSDTVCSYVGFRVLDIYHGQLYRLRSAWQAENITTIFTTFEAYEIRFLLLPGPRHYNYNNFRLLNETTQMFNIVISSTNCNFHRSFHDVWFLWELTY